MFSKKIFLAALLMCVGTGMAAPSKNVQELYNEMSCLGEKLDIVLPASTKESSDADLMHQIVNSQLIEGPTYKSIGEHKEPEAMKKLVDACYDACVKIDLWEFTAQFSKQDANIEQSIIKAFKTRLGESYALKAQLQSPRTNYGYVCAVIERVDAISQLLKSNEDLLSRKMSELDMSYFIINMQKLPGTP